MKASLRRSEVKIKVNLDPVQSSPDPQNHRRHLHDNKSHNWKVSRIECELTNNNPPLLAFPSSTSRNALETWEQVGLTKELSLDIVRLVRSYLALPLLCASDLVSEELTEGRFLCSSPSLSTIVRYVLVHGCTIFLCLQQCCLDDPWKGPSINDKDHLFGLLTRDVHTNNAFDQLRNIVQLWHNYWKEINLLQEGQRKI